MFIGKPSAALGGAILLAFILGCGGGGGSSSNPGPDPNPTTRTVSGSLVHSYMGSGSETPNPIDLSGALIQALIPNGQDYTVHAGTGTSGGTFTIPSVPQGTYLLQVKPASYTYSLLVKGSQDSLQLGSLLTGKPNQPLAGANTYLSVVISNAPSNSRMECVFPSLGTVRYGTYPSAGMYRLSWNGYPLVNTQQDNGWLNHFANFPAQGSDTGYYIQRSSSYPAIQMVNGAETICSPAWSYPTSNHSDSIRIDRSAFDAQRTIANPQSESDYQEYVLFAQPYGLARGRSNSTPPRVAFYRSPTFQGVLNTGYFGYYSPFPTEWDMYVRYEQVYWRTYTIPGASNSMTTGSSILVDYPYLTHPDATVVPLITPPRNVTINGATWFTNLSSVGLTPLLAWDPPATGTPSYYALGIYRIDTSGTYPTTYTTLLARTTDRSLRVPAGVLETGQRYLMILWASTATGWNSSQPFRIGLPYGSAPSLSELITP